MSELTIVKQQPLALDERSKDALRTTLFTSLDGLGDQSRKSWRRFWSTLFKAEVGELFTLSVKFKRNAKFHRKFFALLNFAFEHWEPSRKYKTYRGKPVAKNFERFRSDIIIMAGFYEQTFGLDGRMRVQAQSIAFDKMDDAEFEALYNAVADAILQHVLPSGYCARHDLEALVDQWAGFVR